MPDSQFTADWNKQRVTLAAGVSKGDLWQMKDGHAAYIPDAPHNTGEQPDFKRSDIITVTKANGVVFLDGGRVYWDHSANNATYKATNDRDFYIGTANGDASAGDQFMQVNLNAEQRNILDIARDPTVSALIGSGANQANFTKQIGTRAKVGATAGWVVGAADNLPYVATLPASQSGSTLVIPIDGLRIGDIITGFRVVAQIESAGGTVTIDGDLRATTNVAAEPTDASIGTMTQVSVTADTAASQEKTGLAEVVTSGKTYYLKLTATTAASTDIILQACEITVTRALFGGTSLNRRGGAHNIVISSTTEAQKVDILTRDGFDKAANAIVELIFNVISDGAGTVVDVSLGIANATHATDGDSISEHLFVHLDANNTNIYLQSKDGTTTVAAVDTTIDYTEGTPVEVWFDMRDPADIQVYVNAALVLGASTFRLDNATGPLKLLAHVEKTSASDAYEIDINRLVARISEQ